MSLPAAVCGLEDTPRGIQWGEDGEWGTPTFQEELGTWPVRPAQVMKESWG